MTRMPAIRSASKTSDMPHVRFGLVPDATARGNHSGAPGGVFSAGCVFPGNGKQSLSRMSQKLVSGMTNRDSKGGYAGKYMFSPNKSAMSERGVQEGRTRRDRACSPGAFDT